MQMIIEDKLYEAEKTARPEAPAKTEPAQEQAALKKRSDAPARAEILARKPVSHGILIRGYEMPKNCAECRIRACVLFELEKENREFSILELYKYLDKDTSGIRYTNCPLEEI